MRKKIAICVAALAVAVMPINYALADTSTQAEMQDVKDDEDVDDTSEKTEETETGKEDTEKKEQDSKEESKEEPKENDILTNTDASSNNEKEESTEELKTEDQTNQNELKNEATNIKNISGNTTEDQLIENEDEILDDEEKSVAVDTIILPEPIRDGYKFVEWNTQADGSGDSYMVGDEIEISPMVLYAIWEENE